MKLDLSDNCRPARAGVRPFGPPGPGKPRRGMPGLGLAVLALLAPAAHAQPGTTACQTGSPATPVQKSRTIAGQGTFEMWPQNFQPADPIGQSLPPERDSTAYNGFQRPGIQDGLELFWAIDIVDGPAGPHLYMGYNAGWQIWDIGGAFATDPQLLSQRDGWVGDFDSFENPVTEFYFKIWDIGAIDPTNAPGATLVTLTGQPAVGVTIWDAADKANPFQLYQDLGKISLQVAVANVKGRSYAFHAATNGIQVYDMTRAREIGPCFENTNTATSRCGGNANPVWRGRLGPWPWGRAQYVDVLEADIGGVKKHFVAISDEFVFNALGVEIREITSITSLPPTSVARVQGLDTLNSGLDLFMIPEQASGIERYYLGTANNGALEIYDTTACIAPASVPGETCALGAGQRVFSRQLGFVPASIYVRFSESNGQPFLYQGFHSLCSQPPKSTEGHIEHLLDLGGLATGNPIVEVIGDEYMDPNHSSPQRRINYWSSYYDGATNGFSTSSSHDGEFHGPFFYRAASTLFDIHEFKGETLAANGPVTAYRDDPVTFTASASGCTPSATYAWDPGGGTFIGDATGATVTISWSTPGQKSVSVTNAGCPEAGAGVAAIEVLVPEASVGSVAVSSANPLICETLAFTAQNVTGKPPITYDWEVRDAGGGVVTSGSGTPLETFQWPTGAGTAPGSYTAEVTVTNAANPGGATASAPFVLSSPPALGKPAPTYDGFPADPPGTTVQFRVSAPGATQWRWDYGDGTVETFTTRPEGENPTHRYAVREAPYLVTVTVSNCLNPGMASDQLSVTVNQPLAITLFRARCSFGVCTFQVGAPVTFDQQVSGDPDLYEYDWDGNGSFEVSSSVPVTTHTYTSPFLTGFRPQMRISRGGEQVTFIHLEAITVQAANPPAVSVTGPTARNVNETGTYTASASNCTPAASGWTWTASGGGQITGNTSSNRVTVSWATVGTKTVSARNSACSPAVGNRSVTVSQPPDSPPDTLAASFTFSPATPIAGAPVAFDGSASTGNIGTYTWNFDDGSASVDGVTASHVFGRAGSYDVRLSVLVAGCGNPACFDSITKTVVVSGSSRKLVLPYYLVDLNDNLGATTLFAVRNSTDSAMDVKYEYFSGKAMAPFETETLSLGPHAVRTVTMRSVPGLTDVGTGFATGYVHISPLTPGLGAQALTGDYFRVDETNNFASGDLLVSMPSAVPEEMCRFWDTRFFNGGSFDGGTQFTFYVPDNPQNESDPVVFGDVYDLDGNLVQTLSLTESDFTFEINSSDLELETDFGAIEWSFPEGVAGNVSGIYKARGRFEVGLRGICRDAP